MKQFLNKINLESAYYIFIVLFTFIAFEGLLRWSGNLDTYSETVGQQYQSYYNRVSDNYYQTWKPNDTFELDHKDFKFPYQTNELGVREIPADSFLKRSSGGYRILTLGDSFTEGVGAQYDSAYPRMLEKYLLLKGNNAHVFNAGTSGSDPFFYYVFYRDKLKIINPHLIIIALNGSDITDYIFRGGMERFQNNGTAIFRKGPWYEPFYQHSHVVRFICNEFLGMRDQLFITNKEYEQWQNTFTEKTIEVLKQFKSELPDSTRLMVIIFPGPYDAATDDVPENDITQLVLENVIAPLQKNGIDTLNLFPPLKAFINEDNVAQYTYKNDGHFNPLGYAHFASFIAPRVDSLLKNIQPQTP